MIVCVCVCVCEAMLERKRLNSRGRKDEDTGRDRILRVTRRPVTCCPLKGSMITRVGEIIK
jgi:ribose 1,5-bisphosphokinase PhnN